MSSGWAFLDPVRTFWERARPDIRLLIGVLLVTLIGIAGLTPTYFGMTLSWPFAAFIAAIGWGSGGIAMRPMLSLILFGFAQDVSMIFAPLGVFALLNILVFGLSAGLHQAFDTDRSGGVAVLIPVVCLIGGFSMLWIIASLTNGAAIRVMPVLLSLFSTLTLYILIAPVFDLGRRPDERGVLS